MGQKKDKREIEQKRNYGTTEKLCKRETMGNCGTKGNYGTNEKQWGKRESTEQRETVEQIAIMG
jgi:hypothetical protein